jgi:hypothetical protein
MSVALNVLDRTERRIAFSYSATSEQNRIPITAASKEIKWITTES